MTGKQFKQNRSHPAAALAEQIGSEQKKYQEEHATVADFINDLDNEQKWFALGYLSAQLGANKAQ